MSALFSMSSHRLDSRANINVTWVHSATSSERVTVISSAQLTGQQAVLLSSSVVLGAVGGGHSSSHHYDSLNRNLTDLLGQL